ncbi:MAG TPA: pyridoxal-phosphate dependent enzyme [Cyclobacteriaceae bacterium]|nr:pyridoxal-phosphate dependent enzyme [Cyclobacteriaceae bacterium]
MNLSNHRISIEKIRRAQTVIDPVFLNSPQYNCEPLSEELGATLTIKVETFNPIRSFKGRGADFLISQLRGETKLMCASAGNFGQAMAYACRKKGIKLTIYASTKANPYKIERMRSLGAEVILFGDDFDASKEEAKKQAAKSGVRMIEDGLVPETAEGAGTMALELLKTDPFDALLIPLGNGALFNGIARVFKELSPSTKMVAVQAAGAPAMLDSWKAKKLIANEKIKTIADGIGVRIPIKEALDDMEGLADEGVLVSEESILRGMRLLHVKAGIVPEPSAAVGIAAMLENEDKWKDQRVATIICGGNLTETQIKEWLS